MKRVLMLMLALLVCAITVAGCSSAAPSDFPNKTLRIIVHNTPGAAFDAYARAMVPYLKKYLGQEITVDNIPGAGGVEGVMELYRAKPDGYTIGILDVEKFVTYQMAAKMDYDIKKFEWLSCPATGYYLMGVAAKSNFKTVKDLIAAGKQKPVRYLATEVGSTEVISNKICGLNATFVTGYGGGAETKVALIRGDGDVHTVTDVTYVPYVTAGDVRPLMYFGTKHSEVLKSIGADAPTCVEEGFPELATLYGPRGFAAPPGTPKGIVDVWIKAMEKTYAEPELVAWGKKAGRPIMPETRDDMIKAVDALWVLYDKYLPLFKEYIKF